MLGLGEFFAVVVALICVLITNAMIFVMRNGQRIGKIFLLLLYDVTAMYAIYEICNRTDQTLLCISIFIIYTSGFNMIMCEGK